MKIIRIILIFLTSFGSIQNNNGQQNKGSYYPIEKIVTLTEKSYDFSDTIYQNIGSIIKNKKIILLGDQTHLEGNVTEIKVNLIEYLHEKHNFNIILFEDSFFKLNLFDINKNKIITEKKWDEYFSHYLAGNQQFLRFINFLESEEININNVKIGGFDSQILEQDNTILIESLISFLTQIDIQITEYEKSILEYQFAEAANYPHEGNPIKSDSEKKIS
jgi:erythromycin esterase-like protein